MGKVACRLFGIMAREAPVAVLFRRGPSRWCQMVRWDTRTDEVERGQWFRGRVYERRCDVSPDGTKVIYFAMDARWESESRGSWTAVSKVPFWTALALWPKGDTWNGGGFFLDDHTVFVNGGDPALRGVGQLEVVEKHPWGPPGNTECLGIYFPRLRREGWEMQGIERVDAQTDRVRWTKGRDGIVLVKYTVGTSAKRDEGKGSYYDEHAWVGKDGQMRPMEGVEWADWDQRGKLVFAKEGVLYRGRLERGEMVADMVADLNGGEPMKERSPEWARSW